MGQHGFARDMDFTLDSKTEDTLWFVLQSNEETMEKYPYAFTLRIGYHIEGNKLEVLWQVENPSEEELPFSIGGHPAFNRPKNCKIRFDVAGPLTSTTIVDGLVGNGTVDYELKDSYLTVTDHLFDADALVIENQNVHEVSLCDREGNPYLTVTMDAPLFGIWSPAGPDVPFVCVEPWYGRCDSVDFTGDLKDREWGNLIAPGGIWKARYTVEAV